MTIQSTREAIRASNPLPVVPRDNTDEKHIHNKGSMTVIYDSQGHILKVESACGNLVHFNKSEVSDDGNRNA